MKKILITIILLLSCIGVFSQTTLNPSGTWTAARNIINANFSDVYDSLVVHQLRLSAVDDSIASHLLRLIAVEDSIGELRTSIGSGTGAEVDSSIYTTRYYTSSTFATIANPVFTGIQKVSTTDTLATQAYARSYGGTGTVTIGDVRDEIADSLNFLRPLYVAVADTSNMLENYVRYGDFLVDTTTIHNYFEARIDSIVEVLADTANIEAILQVNLDTDTLATRAYARSVGGGSATIDSLILNGGSLTLIGDDKLTFQTNGIASYSLPAGGGNLMIQSATQDMISDSLDVIRAMIIDSLLLRSEPIFVFGAGGGNPGDTATFTGSGFPVLGSFNTGRDTLMITQVVGQLWDINTTDTLAIQIMYADSLNQTSFTTVWSSATGINADGLNSTSFANPKIPPRKWVWSRVASAIVGRKPTMINVQLNGYRIKAY